MKQPGELTCGGARGDHIIKQCHMPVVVRFYFEGATQIASPLAGKVGIRQDTVSSFELNPESTKLETLFKILAALELSLDIRPRTDPAENATPGWKEEW
jgi:transcriptional regulator with XRE-family HTH domain